MFQFITPWVAFLPMALAAPFYKIWNKKQTIMQFLWLWFVVGLVFLTINGGKRQHYILPLMPAMAILIGILLEDMAFSQKAYTKKFVRNVLLGHFVVLMITFIVLPVAIAKLRPELLFEAIITTVTGLVAVVVIAGLFRVGKTSLALGTLFISIAVLAMLSYVSFINPLNYNQPSRRFTLAVAQEVPPSEDLIAYKSVSTRFIHYFGREVPRIETKTEVRRLYGKGTWVVAFGRYLDELLDNEHFEITYIQENAERHKQNIVAGALFHKSAPAVKDENRGL